MFPMISSKQYWADRAMQTFRYKLALLGILCASAASAQQGPQPPQPPMEQALGSKLMEEINQNIQNRSTIVALQRQIEAMDAAVVDVKKKHDAEVVGLKAEAKKAEADLERKLAAANAEIATLKAENEKLKAPPKAADKSKP